jgi:virginiamycin A acetyltransferase
MRDRFTQDEVRSLVRPAWWGWPIEVITENIRTIAAGPVKDLEQIARVLPR